MTAETDIYGFLNIPPLKPEAPPATIPAEPELAADLIQGHVLPGFGNDHMAMAVLAFADIPLARRFVASIANDVTSMRQAISIRFGPEAAAAQQQVKLAVGLSSQGLSLLLGCDPEKLGFKDEAFVSGMEFRSRAALLGDPVDTGLDGDPANWLFGAGERKPDIVLLCGSDDGAASLRRLRHLIELAGSAFRLLHLQTMDHLEGAAHCREHFGFRDAISQPALRGNVDGRPFSPRLSPYSADQARPGQDLIWPGEFVFGYPGQNPLRPFNEAGNDPIGTATRGAPNWARNGSFLVIRRLRQDVGRFHRFVHENAATFEIPPRQLAALMMGRWPSGAPLVGTDGEDCEMAEDPARQNAFQYSGDTPGIPSDLEGMLCPFASHIRKAYPRDDRSRDFPHFGRSFANSRRMLRRGIPWGPLSRSSFEQPRGDTTDRGLMFMAHMASVRDQFEFVQKRMINDHNSKANGIGYDAIVGQNDTLPNRFRTFKLPIHSKLELFKTDEDWITMTGGEYFFMPSIETLSDLCR